MRTGCKIQWVLWLGIPAADLHLAFQGLVLISFFRATIHSRFESGGMLLKFPGRVGEVKFDPVQSSNV